MKDIAAEAVLFDMYYMAKDPVVLVGEKREMPKIELLPVTEATPIFREFYINDIVCHGAEKGVFIRGIPEMNISDISLTNMVLQARKGIEITEAKGVRFSNVKLVTMESDPVVYLQNSTAIDFNNISYNNGAVVLFSVNGDRSNKIKVTKTDLDKAKNKATFNFGAKASAIEFK